MESGKAFWCQPDLGLWCGEDEELGGVNVGIPVSVPSNIYSTKVRLVCGRVLLNVCVSRTDVWQFLVSVVVLFSSVLVLFVCSPSAVHSVCLLYGG